MAIVLVDLPSYNMVIFHSDVYLPEGKLAIDGNFGISLSFKGDYIYIYTYVHICIYRLGIIYPPTMKRWRTMIFQQNDHPLMGISQPKKHYLRVVGGRPIWHRNSLEKDWYSG